MKDKPCKFVSIQDQNGRISSLEISTNQIEVIGNLNHCSRFTPKTVEDALKLKNWLENWIQNNV